MNLNPTQEEEEFRGKLRNWLSANLPDPFRGNRDEEEKGEYFSYLRSWQRKIYEGGWAGLSWPKEYGGRGSGIIEQAIFQEEWARAEAPPLLNVLGLSLIGPTIIAVGTEEQKQRYLPKILSADENLVSGILRAECRERCRLAWNEGGSGRR